MTDATEARERLALSSWMSPSAECAFGDGEGTDDRPLGLYRFGLVAHADCHGQHETDRAREV